MIGRSSARRDCPMSAHELHDVNKAVQNKRLEQIQFRVWLQSARRFANFIARCFERENEVVKSARVEFNIFSKTCEPHRALLRLNQVQSVRI